MDAIAIIVAAGSGIRAGGDIPKQFQSVGGKPVLDWSLDAFRKHEAFTKIILVFEQSRLSVMRSRYQDCACVSGGVTRAASVKAALAVIDSSDQSRVFIHDAARPGLDQVIIDRLLMGLENYDAVAPALPVYDALKRQTDSGLETVERTDLFRVQTPQAFRLALIKAAHEEDLPEAVDDLQIVEKLGARIKLCEGTEKLSKITLPSDFERVENLLTMGKHL